jgi:hypothetical protein
MTEAQTAAWRESFVAYNHGTVELVAWHRQPGADAATLSFWVSTGSNRHKACSYTPSDPAALLDGLTSYLGQPDTQDKTDLGTTARWKRDRHEMAYTQVGSAAGLVVVATDE